MSFLKSSEITDDGSEGFFLAMSIHVFPEKLPGSCFFPCPLLYGQSLHFSHFPCLMFGLERFFFARS